MPVPKRLGLVTSHALADKLIKILQKFYDIYRQYITPEQLTKINNLINCLREFLEDVPQYPIE